MIHGRTISAINGEDQFVDTTRVICCDMEEASNCRFEEGVGSISLTGVPPTYAVLFPELSKVRTFAFKYDSQEKKFIDSYKEEMLK